MFLPQGTDPRSHRHPREQPIPGLAKGRPRNPRAVWRVKHLGWIHPSEGWGASPHHGTGLEALGLQKVPKKPGKLELPTVPGPL